LKAKIYDYFPGIILFCLGSGFLLRSFQIIPLTTSYLIGLCFSVLSLIYLFFSFGNNRKEGIAISAFLFFVGMVILIPQEFSILNKNLFYLPTYLIIPATIFFLLIIDDFRLKPFGLIVFILIIACLASVLLAENSTTIKFANEIGGIITAYWRELILFVGIGFLLQN